MWDMLSLEFMQNAFIGGILVSVICGVIGSFVVINRMSFIAGGVAHGAYGGIGLAFFLGFAPLFGASVFAMFLGVIIAYITNHKEERSDAVIGAIWAFGMAIGIILIDLTPGYNVDLMSYLFGSILAINLDSIIFVGVCDVLFLTLITLFYRQFIAISFDKEFATLRGVRSEVFYYLLVVMMSLSVVAAIQIVGLILVIALMTIPAFIAEKFSKNLLQMMLNATIISVFFCFFGLVISYKFNLTSGASIILVASAFFFLSSVFKR